MPIVGSMIVKKEVPSSADEELLNLFHDHGIPGLSLFITNRCRTNQVNLMSTAASISNADEEREAQGSSFFFVTGGLCFSWVYYLHGRQQRRKNHAAVFFHLLTGDLSHGNTTLNYDRRYKEVDERKEKHFSWFY